MRPAFATPTGTDALWVLAAECIRTQRGWFAHGELGTAYWLATVLLRDYEAAERAVHDTTARLSVSAGVAACGAGCQLAAPSRPLRPACLPSARPSS